MLERLNPPHRGRSSRTTGVRSEETRRTHALIVAGILQGLSTPPLLLLIMLMTNNPAIMGDRVNGPAINILGWMTTVSIFAASIAMIVTMLV